MHEFDTGFSTCNFAPVDNLTYLRSAPPATERPGRHGQRDRPGLAACALLHATVLGYAYGANGSTMPISIRVATPEDIVAVGALLDVSYSVLMAPSYEPAVFVAALPHMTQLDGTLLTSETYYVAEAGGALAGCGGWSWGQPGTGELIAGQAHIRQFGVHPDWFGRGIGRALYERCEAEARAAGVGRFECFASLNAVGFYDSLGFRQVRPVELTMGETKIRSVIMAREI